MGSSSKVRAARVSITINLPADDFERLDRYRSEYGVPITQFGLRAIRRALDEAGAHPFPNQPSRAKRP